MTVALVIMVKQPVPGRVKTRLCPPLTSAEAAELYRCFLLDKMAQVLRIPAVAPYLAYTPREAEGYFRNLVSGTFALTPQVGQDLGERLNRLSDHLLGAGHPGVAIIDSDTPTLPDHFLLEAVDRMRDGPIDAVFGPAEDGGYYLVGLRRPLPALFQGIAWSTPVVLDQTLGKVRAAGIRAHLLPSWFDVDTGADLVRLEHDLELNEIPVGHTRAFLQRLRLGRPQGRVS